MKTALETQASELDEQERGFTDAIPEHGWFRTSVLPDDEGPGFSYTTGFHLNFDYPELVVFSFKSELAHAVLWDVYRDLKAGRRYPIAVAVSDLFGNAEAHLFPVAKDRYRDLLGWSCWFYGGDEFPCLQLVWPDAGGAFPWQPGASDHAKSSQPDLTAQVWIKSLAH